MNIVREWEQRLKQVTNEIEDYRKIMHNEELNQDMRSFCLNKIQSRSQYKKLIEETLRELAKTKTHHFS